MKKLMLILLAAALICGMTWIKPRPLSGKTPQVNLSKIKRVVKLPHMLILLPTKDYVYMFPNNVVLKARLSRKSKVRFEVRNAVGKLVKVANIEEAELIESASNTFTGQVKIKLKLGKYYVIGAPQTNLGPDTKAVGPIHFSVTIRRKILYAFNHIKVTSPVKGRDYYIGSRVPILWETEKIKKYGYVHVQVCWANGKPAAGTYPVKNTGSTEWLVKETAENSLRIKIFTHDKKYTGMSGVFNLKFPSRKPRKIKNL